MHRYLMLRHLLFTKTTRDQSMFVALMVRDLDKGWVWVWVFTRAKKKNGRVCARQFLMKRKPAFRFVCLLGVWCGSFHRRKMVKASFVFLLATEESTVQPPYPFSLRGISFHIKRNTGSFFQSTTTKGLKTFLGWLLN